MNAFYYFELEEEKLEKEELEKDITSEIKDKVEKFNECSTINISIRKGYIDEFTCTLENGLILNKSDYEFIKIFPDELNDIIYELHFRNPFYHFNLTDYNSNILLYEKDEDFYLLVNSGEPQPICIKNITDIKQKQMYEFYIIPKDLIKDYLIKK